MSKNTRSISEGNFHNKELIDFKRFAHRPLQNLILLPKDMYKLFS